MDDDTFVLPKFHQIISDEESLEYDLENEAASEADVRKIRRKNIKLKDEAFNLNCEWRLCSFQSTSVDEFVMHVSQHIPQLRLRINEENLEVYVCDWQGCDFETNDPQGITRHVNFHSHHTKLKNIGRNLKTRWKLPICQYSSENTNILPDFPEQMICMWSDCGRNFTNIQTYQYHIIAHVNGFPSGKNLPKPISCEWAKCSKSFNSRYHMLNHTKKHTHAKVVGCPDCGSVFCSNTKFVDHCLRGDSTDVKDYQCSHCSKFYSTERLLRDHMISHINHCKCPFCDMTCPYEYTLATHIRHKHMDEKPFKCQICDYRCKSQSDLKKHFNCHETEPLKCFFEDCHFTCKTNITLQRHYSRQHYKEPFKKYLCHICHKQYSQGEVLTRHLIGKHDFHWPSGFSRFRYKKDDEDGFYKLQTVRYESIEVTQAILETEPNGASTTLEDKKRFKLGNLESDNGEFKIKLLIDSEEDNSNADVRNSESLNERLIAIEELDDEGNVVNMRTVEEISSFPAEGMKIVAAVDRDNKTIGH